MPVGSTFSHIVKNFQLDPMKTVGSHTRSRREPIQSKSVYPAWPLSVRGVSYIHRVRSRTGPHSRSRARGVSCVARHGPPARCRVNPARSQLQLPPLPGFCPSTVAVSIQPTHTCVSRRPDCTPLHSHSPRETRLYFFFGGGGGLEIT